MKAAPPAHGPSSDERRGAFNVRACALRQVHAVQARTGRSFPRHTHDEYGVGLILSGAQRSWSGRGLVRAGPGNLITCNPGEVHDGAPIGAERAWNMLYLSPAFVSELAGDIREREGAEFEFMAPVVIQEPFVTLFRAAYAAALGHDEGRAVERLLLLFAPLLQPRHTSRVAGSSAISRAKARIDDDPAAAVTLAELAQEANLSRYQLVRSFRRLIGLPPHAYIVQRRLAAARALIASGAALSDAASASGFADQGHFTRAFTRRFGLTPGKYAAVVRRR